MALPREIVVDTRPLWRLLLSRAQSPLLLAAGALLYRVIRPPDRPEGLSEEGLAALAVFALCVFYWVFDALPLMITGLLAIILIPLSGVMPAAQTYALFGNEAVFFILGAFILAACLIKSGLSTRLALMVLYRFGSTPRTLLVSILLLNASMSFFMSEHAVAAMNFPIILEIAHVLRLNPRRSNYGKALFLMTAWGSQIGGIATLLGGGRAPLAIGMLKEATGKSFTFVQWSAAIIPLVPVLLLACYYLITFFYPIDVDSVRAADEALGERTAKLGRIKGDELGVGIVMIATVLAWIFLGEEFGLANVALGSVITLFVFRLVSWREVEQYVNWGVVLMYGGAICLGAAINKSGAATWLASITVSRWAMNGFSVVLILSLAGIVLTEAMSHSAVVALLMPVSLGIAREFGMDPSVITLAVAVPAGLAFTLPVGTPANAIAYSSGYLTIREMVAPGCIMVVIAWVLFNVMANLYWPLLGLSIAGNP